MKVDINHLVSLAKNGSAEAFGELYSLYSKEMYCYACSVVGDPVLAEDAVSEAVLSAFKEIGSLRKTESFKGWLFKILNAACRKQYKQLNQDIPLDDEIRIETGGARDEIGQLELSMSLREAMKILSAEEKEIVLLRIVNEYGSKDIAEMLNIPDSTVRSKLKRALEKLRKHMTETKGGGYDE